MTEPANSSPAASGSAWRRWLGERGTLLRGWASRNLSVLACAFVLLYAHPYFEGLKNPNELTRVYMTMAIVDHGTYAIDALSPGKYGWIQDRSVSGGHFYACKAPGTSFVGVPVYGSLRLLFGLFGSEPSLRTTVLVLRVFCIVLPLVVFLCLLRSYIRRRFDDAWIADVGVLLCGMGSLLFPYAHVFAGHVLAAVSLGAAFILLDRAVGPPGSRNPSKWQLGIGGALLGLAPTFEYPAVLGSAVVGVWALWHIRLRPRALIWFALPAVLALLPTLHFHWSAFGGPFRTAYPFVEDATFRSWHQLGWLGVTSPQGDSLIGALFSRESGLFPLVPALLPWLALLAAFPAAGLALLPWLFHQPSWLVALSIAVAGVAQFFAWRFVRRRGWLDGRDAVVAVVPALLIAFVESCRMWRSGWSIGIRFLVPAVPFLVIGVARVLSSLRAARRPAVRVVFAGFLLASCVLQVVAGVLYPHVPNGIQGTVAEFLWPMLSMGLTPYSPLSAFGLGGWTFWMPLLIVAGAGFAACVIARSSATVLARLRSSALALATAALLVAGHFYGYTPTPPDGPWFEWNTVFSTWEPRAANAAVLGDGREPDSRAASLQAARRTGLTGVVLGRPPGRTLLGTDALRAAILLYRRGLLGGEPSLPAAAGLAGNGEPTTED
jgi:hypothetical protein